MYASYTNIIKISRRIKIIKIIRRIKNKKNNSHKMIPLFKVL